jgi:hypothetical protein
LLARVAGSASFGAVCAVTAKHQAKQAVPIAQRARCVLQSSIGISLRCARGA